MFIDFHSHILPAADHGSANLETSLKQVALAKEAGVVLTGAGATYPYGNDPHDSNIRIAPSFPTPEELALATEIFVLSVKLVSIDKILGEKNA